MRTLLLIPLCCFLLSSCAKKEDDDGGNNPGSSSAAMALTGTLDDTAFTADYFSSAYPGPLLTLYGYDTHTMRGITLTLNNKDVGNHVMTLDLNGTSAHAEGSGGTIGYYSIHGSGHGSINVTASSDSLISGTFSFTGYTLSGADSAAVSGQFTNFSF